METNLKGGAMGKTYKKKPKKPKMPCALAVLALVMTLPAAASEPYVQGESVLRAFVGYGSEEPIPDTCPALETEDSSFGVGYSYFLTEDVSLDGELWMPWHSAGTNNLSAGVALSHYFGNVFVPLSVEYRNDLNAVAFGIGLGLDYPLGSRGSFRVQAGPSYLADSSIEDHWAWDGTVGFGIRFGK
jgi:hypothetical protein